MATKSDNRITELWPQLVDRLAREQPDAPYGLWPVASSSYDAGFHTVTYAKFANIINGLAAWVVKEIGKGQTLPDGSGPEVLTYVGPNDIRLMAMVLAAVKAGYALLLTSPRNSPAAHQSLFADLQCKTLVTVDSHFPPAVPILDTVKPRCLIVPSLDELLNADTFPVFPYDKTLEEGRWDPCFIMHTSGSTGIPKPKVCTQEALFRHHANASDDLPLPDGATSIQRLIAGKRIMVTLPTFHGAGLLLYTLWAIAAGCVPIAPAAVGIVSAHGLAEALKNTPAEIAMLVPSVVADLAQNPEQLAYCAKHLRLILYIGGDLPQAMGDAVNAQIPLRCWWGASEVGIPHQLIPAGLGPQDWRYVCFHETLGAHYEPTGTGNKTSELVIKRNDAIPTTTFAITDQRELTEYRTKDLFEPHPTVPNTWAWRARADDIIVFLNGEKTNPMSMEQHIVARNHELSAALVVGSQRFQAALLIEPASMSLQQTPAAPLTTSEQAQLIERVWPSVQEANAVAPAHARVEKALILVVDKPMIRAGKGTIQRAASVNQYLAQIDALYANADVVVEDDEGGADEAVNLEDLGSVARFVRQRVNAVTGWSLSDDNDDDDAENSTGSTFFERGMDSLMALQLIRALRRGLHRPDLGLSTIYSNPTVEQLSTALFSGQEGSATQQQSDTSLIEPLFAAHRALIEQIPKPSNTAHITKDQPVTALLTGSTGTIGAYLLRALLDRPGIHHVICLNRAQDGGRAVQKERMAERGLAVADLDERTTFLHADLGKPQLGLDDATYAHLLAVTGLVIHNAWPVNFNLTLPAFRPQFLGLVNLLRLAGETQAAAPRVAFVSSVSAVAGAGTIAKNDSAPEAVLALREAPRENGYAQSKFLSELLCDAAARELGIPVTVVRVGQVAGAVRLNGAGSGGEWNRKEWLPSLVLGSLAMGCFPDSLGGQFSEIDWVPVDVLADVLVDLVNEDDDDDDDDEGSGKAQVFNVRNPQTTTWDKLLPSLLEAAKASRGPDCAALEVVSPAVWLEKLEQVAAKDDDDEGLTNPAITLLDFYRNHLFGAAKEDGRVEPLASPPMSVERAVAHSATLRDTEAVGPQWVKKWVGEWLA